MSDFDVIVLGSGFTGLRAAVAASAAGASVVVVEAQPEIGGRSQYSFAHLMGAGTRFQKEAGVEDSPEALFKQYMRLHEYQIDAANAHALTFGIGEEIEWLADNGLVVKGILPSETNEVSRIHRSGGGWKIIEVLLRLARDQGVEFILNTRVDRLLTDDGRVIGVEAGDEALLSKTVILATGGFGGNKELVAEWLPSVAALAGDWVLPVGGEELARFAQGDAIPLASAVGAQIAGKDLWEVTLRPGYVQVSLPSLPGHMVLVDAKGRRFVDECAGVAAMQGAVRHAQGPVHLIFDDAGKSAYKPSGEILAPGEKKQRLHPDYVEDVVDAEVERGSIVKADTIDELAVEIGIEPASLRGTLQQYNEDARAGYDSVQLKDPADMRPIETGPFYATEMRLASVGFTGAGPRVNARAAVLDQNNVPIPGLFAGGECASGIAGYGSAMDATPTATCLVFGRIAGESAAAFAHNL
ncbi:MAG: FAD-dependent oxidoreductase [Actinomycetota bacterium]|nr:FAD-dependent oxidoreductase [Actinomycetota bacterium]